MENFEDFINKKCEFFKEKFKHLEGNFFYASWVSSSEMTKKSNDYINLGEVSARRENWGQKIDRFVAEGFSTFNLESIFFTPSKDEEADYYFIGKIDFRSSDKMIGEIEFHQKYIKGTLVRSFISASYRISYLGENFKMREETSDWEEGVKLIALSINDFEKHPDVFIEERIKKWQK